MKRWLVVLPILTIALLGAGCQRTSPPVAPLQQPTATLPPQPSTVPQPPPAPAVPTPSPSAAVVDCGQAGPVTAPGSTVYQASEATAKAWGCFVAKFEACASARVQAAMDARSPSSYINFEISGERQGARCLVRGPRVNIQTGQLTTVSCAISRPYLDAYFIGGQKNNTTLTQSYLKGYLMANLVMFGGGKSLTTADGTTDQVACQ